MNMHIVAFIVGLVVALANADVRDILKNQQSVFSAGQPFAKQQQQPQQQITAGNGKERFWWADSLHSPFTKSISSRAAQYNTIHNTPQQHHTKHQQQPQQQNHDYSHNPFMNGAYRQQQQPNIYAQMASLSGSPNEVNNLMLDAVTQPRYYQTSAAPKIPCYGALQVCAPKNACRNGFISENDLGLVQSQSNNCDSQTEACCNIEPNEQRYDQPQPCIDANSACVSSKHCFNGYIIDQSAEQKATAPNASGFCQQSEVCCRFSLSKSANLILDNEFAAAAQSTSEVLTKEGYVVNVPSNQYLPSRPETEYNPDSSNQDQSLLRPSTARPAAPKCSNGAPDSTYPDCCTNGGRGSYCCTNGVTNNQYCCANGAQNPECVIISDEPQPQTQRPITQAPQTQRPIPQTQRPQTVAPQTQRPQTQQPYQPQQPQTQRPVQPQQPQTQRPVQPQQPYQPQTQRPVQPQTQRPIQPRPTQRPYQPNPNVNVQDEGIFLPVACAAAMNCTAEEFCDSKGRISKTPVDLNDLMRVPMTDCLIKETGAKGKCCIDPDYTDPWPTGRTGQYVAEELNAVFDDGSYRPDRQNVKRQTQARNQNQVAANTNQVITRVAPPRRNIARRQSNNQLGVSENKNFPAVIQTATQAAAVNNEKCGARNLGTQPRGRAPLGTGFGEFTWVAMVILESRKALLCGGAIISPRLVVTSGNCVHGHRHNDVLIKAGEWRLGSDEEPKPFQIVRVQRIIFHPQYQPKTLQNDIALLYLENDIKYDDTHIQPICLDDSEAINENCVTTGWGKEVLKVHLGNALMQHTSVSLLPQADCQSRLASTNLEYSSSIVCGVTQYDACQVDNGSALACADRSGRYVLKGVYSKETDCENPNQIVAFTRADHQWIQSVLRNPAHAARS